MCPTAGGAGLRSRSVEPHPRQVLFIAGVLAAIVLLGLLYGKLLTIVAGYKGPALSALAAFMKARFEGTPMRPAEVKALVILAAVAVAVAGAAGGGWYFAYVRWYAPRRSLRLLQDRFSSEKGTAQWADTRELQKLLGSDGVLVGYAGGLVRRPVRFSLQASCEHLAVIGPTGCGKTSCFFIPNLLSLPPGTSVVVTDPKGELERVTGPVLRSRGWETVVFNPYAPERSAVYNPLEIAKSGSEIEEIAQITLRNGYFSQGEAGDAQWVTLSLPLWEACLYAELEQHRAGRVPSIQGAYELVTLYTEQDRAEVFKSLGGVALDRYLAYAQSIQSPETAASIKTIVSSSLKVFLQSNVAAVTSGRRTFDFMSLRQRPTAIFIQVPVRKAHFMKPLTATLYWQMLEHICDEPGLPVVFFLDEFPNIGEIPGFAEMAATLRSRRISLCVGIQGVEQLGRVYGEHRQWDILNNLKTKVFFPGSTGKSGPFVQEMGGYTTVVAD